MNQPSNGKSGKKKGKKKSKTLPALGKIKFCSQVWLLPFPSALQGPYLVIAVNKDRVLLARHYLSENQFKEQFSQLGTQFVVNRNQCVQMADEKLPLKGAGDLNWLLTDYARSMRNRQPLTLNTISVNCQLRMTNE